MRVGVIGLGRIGLPIARNLMARGFVVTGYRRSGCGELEAAGGLAAASPAEVAARSDILLSILPDVDAVAEVVHGPAGMLTTVPPGTVHLEMSAIDATQKARIRDAVRAAGVDLLDCGISGTPDMVARRQATTFVAGERTSVEAVRPVLDAISGQWAYADRFGDAVALKHIANLLLMVHAVAEAEAFAFAARLGIDTELVRRIMDSSIAGPAIGKQRGRASRARPWSPAVAPISALRPILEQIADAAAAAGVDLPVFAATEAAFDKAIADGRGQLDIVAWGAWIASAQSGGEATAVNVSSDT